MRECLESGPKYFIEIMEALGSADGREIVMEIEKLRAANVLYRTPNGQWCLAGVPDARPANVPAEIALNPH